MYLPDHFAETRSEVLQALMRAHPFASLITTGADGPQAYVTPSWYETKREHGRLRVIDDPLWLRQQLETLVAAHEAGFFEPWQIANASLDYIDTMPAAVAGLPAR